MYQVVLEKSDESLEITCFDFYETACDYADEALSRGYVSASICDDGILEE